MKKKFLTALLAVSCVGLSVGSVFAAELACSPVSIYGVGINNGSIIVTLTNAKGVACGDWANGANRQFNINPAVEPDQTYAAVLTAFSMGKNISMKAADSVANSYLITVGVLK
jgi:hypothetical protein